MKQHIWIKIGIVQGILIIIETFRAGKICMGNHISGQQIDDIRIISSGSVTSWGGWRAGQWRSRLSSSLSASVGWRWTCFSPSLACLLMLSGAMLPKEGSWTFGFDEALPGVVVSQPSPFHAQETQHPATSLLGPQRMIS
jgi:hypothetical protein